jgi:hypothetical protein
MGICIECGWPDGRQPTVVRRRLLLPRTIVSAHSVLVGSAIRIEKGADVPSFFFFCSSFSFFAFFVEV